MGGRERERWWIWRLERWRVSQYRVHSSKDIAFGDEAKTLPKRRRQRGYSSPWGPCPPHKEKKLCVLQQWPPLPRPTLMTSSPLSFSTWIEGSMPDWDLHLQTDNWPSTFSGDSCDPPASTEILSWTTTPSPSASFSTSTLLSSWLASRSLCHHSHLPAWESPHPPFYEDHCLPHLHLQCHLHFCWNHRQDKVGLHLSLQQNPHHKWALRQHNL